MHHPNGYTHAEPPKILCHVFRVGGGGLLCRKLDDPSYFRQRVRNQTGVVGGWLRVRIEPGSSRFKVHES
eukprot:3934320-Rhodomonas_salina.2